MAIKKKNEIESDLWRIMHRHGVDQVCRSFLKILLSEDLMKFDRASHFSIDRPGAKPMAEKRKATAVERVEKMGLPTVKKSMMLKLAKSYQEKTFLPTVSDVRNFYRFYGVEESAPRSRMNAIPRLFDFVATMSSEDILEIIKNKAFSGPSKLEPIADAIRRGGRTARLSTGVREDSRTKTEEKPKPPILDI